MGIFSEMALDQQTSMVNTTAAFEEDDAFEQEDTDRLPVPPVTIGETVAAVPPAQDTALPADEESTSEKEDSADEESPSEEDDSAEETEPAEDAAASSNTAQKAVEDDEKKRAEHEAAEAKRKEEWDAKQKAKKDAEQAQMARLATMSDDDVVAASTKRVCGDVEKLTRRNMKECVSEQIQMLCMEDAAFARLTMHPNKTMLHCFQYINRKAWDYVQDELKANGIQPGTGAQGYGSDVPDDLCYQWAEEYFRDPDAKEDHAEEEKFVSKPYYGKSSSKSKPKKTAEKKKAESKTAVKSQREEKEPSTEGQMSLLDLGMLKAG